MQKLEDLVNRADRLIELAEETLRTRDEGSAWSTLPPSVNSTKFGELRSAALSFIEGTFGIAHTYYREFGKDCSTAEAYRVESGLGTLRAMREEIAGGWLETTRGIIAAEVFSDFLEMAEHFLAEGYKDPAAVMIGSVLEDHIRQLAKANGVDIEELRNGKLVPRKADILNAELKKAGVYDSGDHKQVTAWLDLRNNAAHGNYERYTGGQVELFLGGVRQFLARIRP